MIKKIDFQNSRGQVLHGKYSSPKQPTEYAVVMCHGYGSSMNDPAFIAMEKSLNRMGIAAFRFSFLGQTLLARNPEVISATECLDDAMKAYELMKKQHSHVGLIGVSLGGLAAILAASELNDVWCLGLVCPALYNLGEIFALIYSLDIKKWKKEKIATVGLFKRLPYSIYTDAQQYDIMAAAEKIRCPVKYIAGTKDPLIPVEYGREFVKRLKVCDYYFVEGADHVFSNNSQIKVFRDMVKFFKIQREAAEKSR